MCTCNWNFNGLNVIASWNLNLVVNIIVTINIHFLLNWLGCKIQFYLLVNILLPTTLECMILHQICDIIIVAHLKTNYIEILTLQGTSPCHSWKTHLLRFLVMQHCDKMWYPYIINKLFARHIPTMLTKKLEEYVCFLPLHNLQQPLPHLISGCFNLFTFVIKLINDKWIPCHVIIGLFEALGTLGTTLAKHVKSLLAKYHLINNFSTYVKTRGTQI